MTSPLSPEAVAQMVADREAGTPGPWHFDGPVWNQIVWTGSDNRLCFMAHSNGLNDDRDIANASRIARLPDLEAAYLTLAAENATLRHDRDVAVVNNDVLRIAMDTLRVDTARMLAEADREYNRKTNALIDRHADRLATLRASEAAALERGKVLTEALNQIIKTDDRGYMYHQDGPYARIARQALTPTADKE